MIDIDDFKASHHILIKDAALNGLDGYAIEKIFSLYSSRLGELQYGRETEIVTDNERMLALNLALQDFQKFRSAMRLVAELARDERKKFFDSGQLVVGTEVEILAGRNEGYSGQIRATGDGNARVEIVRDGRSGVVEVPFAKVELNRIETV